MKELDQDTNVGDWLGTVTLECTPCPAIKLHSYEYSITSSGEEVILIAYYSV